MWHSDWLLKEFEDEYEHQKKQTTPLKPLHCSRTRYEEVENRERKELENRRLLQILVLHLIKNTNFDGFIGRGLQSASSSSDSDSEGKETSVTRRVNSTCI